MDAARDLGRVEPWQKSLERSLARRGSSNRSPRLGDGERVRLDVTLATTGREARREPRQRRHGIAARVKPLVRVGVLLMLGGLAAASASGFGGVQARGHRSGVDRQRLSHTSRRAASGGGGGGACRPAVGTSGYANPLADARVRPERIDQGVDYAGSGTLTAIGAARVTYVGSFGTGWPGAFIEYMLLDGADAGCYVYYAEGVTPMPGMYVGEKIAAGEAIATIIRGYPTGTEVGWAAGSGTKTYAAATGQWSPNDDQDNVASTSGKSFSALIAALGGPPGTIEG